MIGGRWIKLLITNLAFLEWSQPTDFGKASLSLILSPEGNRSAENFSSCEELKDSFTTQIFKLEPGTLQTRNTQFLPR
ncbi:hypothetical protein J6590_081585 [Homalodisca vitripennis]|nr:hypothetical protein J6590_081585 [Homalodisca vitripennis]